MMNLLQFIDCGNTIRFEAAIRKNGIPKDTEWSDYVLLRYALWRNQTNIAKFLIQQGCRLNKTSKSSTNTPLHIVVKHEDEELTNILLEKGASFDSKNNMGETPLHFAAKTKNNKIINLILAKISSTYEGNPVNKTGLIPLHIACMRNDPSDVENLLRCGAPINDPVPLDSAFWPSYTPLHLAVEFQHLDVVHRLLCSGVDLSCKNSKGITALHLAVQYNYLPIVDLILKGHERFSNNINPTDERGFSHFHIACMRNNSEVVEGFIKRGVEINSQINEKSDISPGSTPLHLAVEYLCVETIELLLCYGADVSLKNVAGLTPLHLAIQCENKEIMDLILSAHSSSSNSSSSANPVDDRDFSHFHAACMRKNPKVVQAFLEHGVDVNRAVNANSPNWPLYTPLHFAVENNSLETVKMLLNRGADVNAADLKGTAPLHLSTLSMNEEMVRLLLANGAYVNVCTTTGMTPLHIAVERGNLELVKLLIQHDANVNCAEALKYSTPLHLATLSKNLEMIEMLLTAGADVNARARDGKTALHTMSQRDSKRELDTELTEVFNKIITSLVDAGCNIDTLDGHGRTPLHMTCIYRSPSGAYALLQNGADFNIEDHVGKTPVSYFFPSTNHIFLDHIEKLHVLKFPICDTNETCYQQLKGCRQYKRKWNDEVEDTFMQRCTNELDRMRALRIDSYSSLFSIIFKGQNDLALHAMNETLKEMVLSEEFDKSFPLYGYLIKLQFKKGMARMVLMNPAKDSLEAMAGHGLPDSCSESILQYLTNQDLKKLISVRTVQTAS